MYKRVLTIQDISCLGQCSLTVALPILSACGHETCVLPSAVLSTHTGGFTGFTFRDLTEDMPAICRHWESAGIRFDAIYFCLCHAAIRVPPVFRDNTSLYEANLSVPIRILTLYSVPAYHLVKPEAYHHTHDICRPPDIRCAFRHYYVIHHLRDTN